MKHSETIANLAASLVAAQADLRAVGKDSVNPHFKNRYASLDAIVETTRPVLAKHGLAVVQGASPIVDEHTLALSVETMLVHKSGEWLSNVAVVPVSKMDAQGAGGALTYGRRYGLSALLSLATDEDDDGNTAAKVSGVKSADAGKPHIAASTPEARQQPAPAPAADLPSCPKCGGTNLWDNRAENAARAARGEKARPDFKCKAQGCDGVIWPPKGPTKSVKVVAPKSDDEAWQDAVASAEGADGLPF